MISRLLVGTKVEANYRSQGRYYPGKVTRDREDGSYDVAYEDGESELRVNGERIRLLASPRPKSAGSLRLAVGSRVNARRRDTDRFSPGLVEADRGDGSFDVRFDEGGSESGVREEWIRLLPARAQSKVAVRPQSASVLSLSPALSTDLAALAALHMQQRGTLERMSHRLAEVKASLDQRNPARAEAMRKALFFASAL
ncbi:hypothetical protein EON64_09510 [archaeon]|nr:MAG: hypothetical protein EON64_09510 [archaeon]